MDPSLEEGFIGVHVADARDERLVEENGLNGRLAVFQDFPQRGRGEGGVEGLYAQHTVYSRLIVSEPHHAEFTGVAEMDSRAVVQVKYGAGILIVGRIDQQGAGHFHVHDQDAAAVQMKKEIFAAAGEPEYFLTGNPSFEGS